MSRLARRLWKLTAAAIATVLILLAIGVGLFRVAVPLVPGFKSEAEALAERAIGWPVSIGEMDLRWAWLGPELVLHDVRLLAPDTRQPLVSAARIDIAFGPADLFQDGALRPSHLRLQEPTLALERTADGRLVLSGYALPERQGTQFDWRELLELGLQHGRLTVVDGELHYRDVARDIQDWRFLLPHVSLASNGAVHEIEGTLVPPGTLGEQVAFRFRAQGPPGRPEAWGWTGDVGARELRLAWWYQQFPWAGEGLLRGALNFAASFEGRGLERVAGQGRLVVSNLGFASREPAMQPPGSSATTDLGSLAMQWRLEHSAARTGIDVQELAIERAGRQYADISISVQSGEGEYPLHLAVARFPLQELAAFAPLLPVAASGERHGVRETIQRLAPRGELSELVLSVAPEAEPVRFRVQAAFEQLGFDAWNGLPGVDGLSGRLRGDRAAGKLRIDSRDVSVDTGTLFRGPLPARRLAGEFGWTSDAGGNWKVTGNDIVIENPEVSAEGAFTLDIPDDAPAVIDMTATAYNADFRARSRWLPVGIMSDALVEWLDEGVIAGHAPEATLTLRGPLASFPFRDGSGVFDIRFRAEDTMVEYAPGWPRVKNLSAAVRFHNAGMEIQVDRADMLDGLNVKSARASFADFRDGLLHIRADVEGDTDAAWKFLAASPLAESLEGLLGNLSPRGPFDADLSLDIPLDDVERLALAVDADLEQVNVDIDALPWDVEALTGHVRVTERAVTAEMLRGTFTGAPLALGIESGEAAGDGFAPVRVLARGRSPVGAFDEFIPEAWLQRLEGDFGWQAEVRVAADAPLRVDIDSSLDGLASRLPAPLHKVRPVDAGIVLADENHIDAELVFDELGAARLRFVDEPGGWRFDRGHASYGAAAPPPLPDNRGLVVDGRVPLLAADGWLSLDGETRGEGGSGAADEELLRAFDLQADRLTVRSMTLANQAVAGRRSGGGWELMLKGPVSGVVAIPSLEQTGQPLHVLLETLHLPSPGTPAGVGTGGEPLDPRTLPGIVLDVRDFQVGPVHLGHVRGELKRTSIGYTTQQLTANAPSFDLSLDGRWEFVQGEHYTSVVGELVSRDLDETLAAIGYRGGLDADDGRVAANIAWHGSPFEPQRARMEGNVNFAFRDGTLREVKPGAGRLIGLLSIAALPRRLLLDFSDLFGEGLHFDTLTGDFLVTDGNAYTTNVQLRGPSVSALLVGRTGIVAEDYDQLVIVNPDVSASLPVAGYLAAGPSVGAALLLLSQLLKAPLSDITQMKYRVTGTWDDPVIERIGPSGNEQKNAQPAH